MELTQLRYFLHVYDTGNICAAATQLSVSQQAISKQIQKLERELGVALFIRHSRGVQATPYADLLAEKTRGFMPGFDAFVYNIQMRNKEISGVVNLGIQCWQMSVEHGLRYDVLRSFALQYPRVHLIWENCIPKECLQGLRSRRLDMAVTIMPEDPDEFELTPLRHTEWFMLMSKRHPLSNRPELTVDDLSAQRIIVSDNEIETRRRINRVLEGKVLPCYIGVEDFIFDLIGQQIEGENAMMLTTETTLDMFNPERFTTIPLKGNIWDTNLYLTRLVGASHTPAQQALFQHLIENWR